KPPEAANDRAGNDSCDDECERSHAEARGDLQPSKYQKKAKNRTHGDVSGTDAVRTPFVVAVRDERGKDVALDARQVCVEMVFQAGHRDGFADRSSCEEALEQCLLMRLQLCPFPAILLHDEVVVL